jgi:TM2 domain-containing membrane protein YozV
MRKIIAFFFACLVLSTSVSAAVVKPFPGDPTPAKANVSPAQLSKMSVKEFQKLTGKKMNFAQKLAFKAMQKAKNASAEGKSQLTALLLCWLVGIIGVHRFYLGYTWQGIVQILTLGGLGIWTLIDLIRIITGSLQPKDSEYAKTL